MTNISVRLRELREEKGLSMMQLAKAIKVSDAAISRWENKIRIPNADTVYILAKYFEVSADYLLGLTDY